jgi:outer membrane protein assembly factor BamB
LVSYNTSDGSKRWESVNVSDSFSEGHYWPMDVPEEIALDPSGSRLFIVLNNGIYSGDGVFSTAAYDTTSGKRIWEATFSSYTSRVHAVAVSHDGERVFVLGTDCFEDYESCTHKKLVVIAYDVETGDQLWANAIPGRKPGDIRVGTDDRTVYIVGISRFMNLAALDAQTGRLSWTAKTIGRKTAPERLLLSEDGSTFFLVGSACVREACRTRDYYIAAHDEASGDQRWIHYYDIYDRDDRLVDAEVADDRIVLSGTSFAKYSGEDKYFFTLAAREDTGKTIWKRFTAERSEVSDVAVSGDGAVAYVTGTTSTFTHGPEQQAIAYGLETGAGLWSRSDPAVRRPRYSVDIPGPAAVTHPSSDQLFLVGSAPDGDSSVAESRAIDGITGATVWSKAHNGIGEVGSSDILIDVAVAADGSRIFAVGESFDGQADTALAVVALDPASGATTWVRRDSTTNPFLIRTASASPDGSQIVVAGSSNCCGDSALFAASYEGSTGADRWRHRLDGSKGNGTGDEATTIVFSSDGAEVFYRWSISFSEWRVSRQPFATRSS